MALASEELEVKAITSVFGNVSLRETTNNALTVLELCRLEGIIPVGMGSGAPLKRNSVPVRDVHGLNGLGNFGLSCEHSVPKTDGIGLIISKINAAEADTLIATGPLTNIARVLSRDSAIKKKIKEIYIMGGAVFVEGNITAFAEFNFYSDPEAADYVLNSGIEIVLISLDVTHKVIITDEHLGAFKEYKGRLAEFVRGIIGYSIDFHGRCRKAAGAYLHDPFAVAIAVSPKLGEYERLSLTVDCADKRGRVKPKDGAKTVRFVRDVDVEGFLKLFLTRIGGKIEAIQNI